MDDAAECEIDRDRSESATERGPLLAEPLSDAEDQGRLRQRLVTSDGVRLEAAYLPYDPPPDQPAPDPPARRGAGRTPRAERTPALVLAHGFTGALDRPAVLRAARLLSRYAAVVTFSFRGHGRSDGESTVGDLEVRDLAAAVRWARALGHGPVATVGFSMGGSVVVRHGALMSSPDLDAGQQPDDPNLPSVPGAEPAGVRSTTALPPNGAPTAPRPGGPRSPNSPDTAGSYQAAHADVVVAVSAPARWYYRGTASMRRLHFAIQHPLGRLVSRYGLRTRVRAADWDPVPLPPVAAAPLVAPTPLLVVHGDRDPYFPLDHPHSLVESADPNHTELWIESGFGHAENAAPAELLHRIGAWTAARLSAG